MASAGTSTIKLLSCASAAVAHGLQALDEQRVAGVVARSSRVK